MWAARFIERTTKDRKKMFQTDIWIRNKSENVNTNIQLEHSWKKRRIENEQEAGIWIQAKCHSYYTIDSKWIRCSCKNEK